MFREFEIEAGKRGLGASRFRIQELLRELGLCWVLRTKNNCWQLINSMIDRKCRIVPGKFVESEFCLIFARKAIVHH